MPKLASDYFYIGKRRPTNQQERAADDTAAEQDGQTQVLVVLFLHTRAPVRGLMLLLCRNFVPISIA